MVKFDFNDCLKIDYQLAKTLYRTFRNDFKSINDQTTRQKIQIFNISNKFNCMLFVVDDYQHDTPQQHYYLLNDYQYLKWCVVNQAKILKQPELYFDFAPAHTIINPQIFTDSLALKNIESNLNIVFDFILKFLVCPVDETQVITNFVIDHKNSVIYHSGVNISINNQAAFDRWKSQVLKINKRFQSGAQFVINEQDKEQIAIPMIDFKIYQQHHQHLANNYFEIEQWKVLYFQFFKKSSYYLKPSLIDHQSNGFLGNKLVSQFLQKPWIQRLLSNHFSFLKPSDYLSIKKLIYLVQNSFIYQHYPHYQWETIIATWIVAYLKTQVETIAKAKTIVQKWNLITGANNEQLDNFNDMLTIINFGIQNPKTYPVVDRYLAKFNQSNNLNKIKQLSFDIDYYESEFYELTQFHNNDLIQILLAALYEIIYDGIGNEYWALLRKTISFLPKTISDIQTLLVNQRSININDETSSKNGLKKSPIKSVKKIFREHIIANYQNNNYLDEGRVDFLLNKIESNVEDYFENKTLTLNFNWQDWINKINQSSVDNYMQIMNPILKDHPIYYQGKLQFFPIRSVGEAFLLSTHFSNCAIQRALKIVEMDETTFFNETFNYLLIGYNPQSKQFVSMVEILCQKGNQELSVKNELGRFNNSIDPANKIDLKLYQKEAFKPWSNRISFKKQIEFKNEVHVKSVLEKAPHLLIDREIVDLLQKHLPELLANSLHQPAFNAFNTTINHADAPQDPTQPDEPINNPAFKILG